MKYLVYKLDNEIGSFTCDEKNKEWGFQMWLKVNNIKNSAAYHVVESR